MEAPSSLKGYSITEGKIPILITLRKTSDLRPHEETVPDDLGKLVQALKDNPVLRHPIIADWKTGIVLDGTHRLAAVKQLNCDFIPSALVDYNDPKITIERWFRRFSGPNVEGFENDLSELNPQKINHKDCEDGLSKRRWYAIVESATSCLAFKASSSEPYDMMRDSQIIEKTARNDQVIVSYNDSKERDLEDSESLFMSTIEIRKEEVVETVRSDKVFPPKSTRHLVPSRPLGGGVPIEWLKGSDFAQAQARYNAYIQARKIRRLPEGSRIGSRRYLEEVFLFE